MTWKPVPAMARSRLCSGCICQKRYVIGVVGVGNCFCGVPSASFLSQFETDFFDFINRCSKHLVYTDDEDLCVLSVRLLQCQSSLCLHPENGLLPWCFYRESLWLRRFLLVGRKRVEFPLSFLCEWSQSALPSAHNVYRLPCYLTLPNFNRVSNLINLILYVFCLFCRYMFANSSCAFFFKFQGIYGRWVLPIALGCSFHVCTLFSHR